MQPHKRKREPRPGDHRGTAFNNPRPGTKWHELAARLGCLPKQSARETEAELFGVLYDDAFAKLMARRESELKALTEKEAQDLAAKAAADLVAWFTWAFGDKPKRTGSPGRDPFLEVVIAAIFTARWASTKGAQSSGRIFTALGRSLGLSPDTVRRAALSGGRRYLSAHQVVPQDGSDAEKAKLEISLMTLEDMFKRAQLTAAEMGICKNA